MELNYTNNSKSLFRKYAKLATWFANTKIGREYLGLKFDEPIGLFLPNGYHKILKVNKKEMQIQAQFSSRTIYAAKLYPILQVIDSASMYLGSFDDAKALLQAKLNIASKKDLSLILGLPHFAVATFNPNANVETTSVDGYAQRSVASETFTTIVNGAGTGSDDSATDQAVGYLRASTTSNQFNLINRGFMLFDSSTLTASATISSATFQLYATNDASQKNDFSTGLALSAATPASNTAIVNADYNIANWGSTRFADTDQSLTGYTQNAYFTMTLNASGIAAISKTSITKFGVRIAKDFDASAPAWVSTNYSGLYCQFADGANDPTLNVTYTLPSGYSGSFAAAVC